MIIPVKQAEVIAAVYLIVCKITNEVYVGACKNLYVRMHIHRGDLRGNRHHNSNLQRLYNLYGESNFEIKYKQVNYTEEDRKYFEERFIALYPTLNIAKYPTKGGKPNKGRVMSSEWRENMHKNKDYKHSYNTETLSKVTQQNKEGACKLKFYNDNEVIFFDSWIVAADSLNTTPSALLGSYRRHSKWKEFNIDKITTQKKQLRLYTSEGTIDFNSYGECDRYLGIWKGATSFYLKRDGEINGMKIENLENSSPSK